MQEVRYSQIPNECHVHLPKSVYKKVLILDMDETLIHCVDDIDQEQPDVILEILFPDEDEAVCAGINFRPYLV